MHHTMTCSQRVQSSMEGFLILDLYRIIAEISAARNGFPRGSQFISPQTQENLQMTAMSTIIVALTKDESGDPYSRGHARMSELAIEQWFGRLRVQSSSASLSTRGYWQAAARDMLRAFKSREPNGPAPEQKHKPLDDAEFKACSERALEAALALVAHTSGVTVSSLTEMYDEWCKSGRFTDTCAAAAVSPDEVDIDEDEGDQEELDECQRVLRDIEDSMGVLEDEGEGEGEDSRSEGFGFGFAERTRQGPTVGDADF